MPGTVFSFHILQRKDSSDFFSRLNETVCPSAASQGENATFCEMVPKMYLL